MENKRMKMLNILIIILLLGGFGVLYGKDAYNAISNFLESGVGRNNRLLDDSGVSNKEVEKMINSNNQFAIDLYDKYSKKYEGENIFYSPYSISTALSMVYEGAEGKTAEEIAEVFYLLEDDEGRRASVASVYNDINSGKKDYQLNTANALWINNDFPVNNSYVNIISDFYGGKVQNMDFINSSESSRKEINSWVENQTESKIKDLLSKGSVNSMTRLVLTNAIYFKGDWKEAFSEDCTYKDSFFLSNGDRTEVDMMCMGDKNKKFNYFEEDDLQVIELPYKGEDISMMILLPKQGNLKELEGNITPESLERYRNEMQREKVKIFLPSFKLETQYSMSQDLADMGMPKAFTPDAEFTGMSEASGDKLFISNIIHKAFVELDEVGTEAAAATGVTMEITAMPTQTVPIFDADHPFIFMIQDGDTGNVLFMGKLENPNT